jgi:hypothetical protein
MRGAGGIPQLYVSMRFGKIEFWDKIYMLFKNVLVIVGFVFGASVLAAPSVPNDGGNLPPGAKDFVELDKRYGVIRHPEYKRTIDKDVGVQSDSVVGDVEKRCTTAECHFSQMKRSIDEFEKRYMAPPRAGW